MMRKIAMSCAMALLTVMSIDAIEWCSPVPGDHLLDCGYYIECAIDGKSANLTAYGTAEVK